MFLTTFCYSQSNLPVSEGKNQPKQSLPDTSLTFFNFLTLSDAEKILEQPAFLKDSTWYYEAGGWKYKSKYFTKKSKSNTTQIRAELFFAYEKYKQTSDAKSFFDFVKNENSKNSIVSKIDELGDEAIVIRDKFNNPFVLIRLDNKIYKITVNDVTSNDSFNSILLVAKKLIDTP